MCLVAYIKTEKFGSIRSIPHTNTKACGVGKLIGNKGGIQIHFNYGGKYFNFIGCHLLHGQ